MFKNGLTIITVGKYVQYWPCINLFILIERFRVPFRISQNRKHAAKSSSKQLFGLNKHEATNFHFGVEKMNIKA